MHEVLEGGRHVLDGVEKHDLALALIGPEAGRSGLDDVAQLDDGGDGVLRGLGKLFLRGSCPGHQSLGVLNQSLSRRQDLLSVV